MKNIKKYLCAIVMMVISMTAFAQEDVFSGDWLGANKEGDLKVAFTLNCDGNWQLNPYNENARCNGFMEVNMLEPAATRLETEWSGCMGRSGNDFSTTLRVYSEAYSA